MSHRKKHKKGEAWREVPGGYPQEEGTHRRCNQCSYAPIARGERCPNCGRDFIGDSQQVPTDDKSPRGRQGAGHIPEV